MSKKFKQMLACLMTVVMLMSIMPLGNVFASDIVDSGTCGDNVTWVLDSEGTLTISGEGEMWDYSTENDVTTAPWGTYMPNIISIVIEEGITNIGSSSFGGLVYLKKVSLPDGIQKIRDNAFTFCGNLESINIPETVEYVDFNAFAVCASLKDFTIPNNVYIGNGAFQFCCSLEELYVPKTATIDGWAFYSSGLRKVCFENGVTTINEGVFCECTSLKEVEIPETVEYIYDEAFYECYSLTDFTIPKNIVYIGKNAFFRTSNLSKIKILTRNTSLTDTGIGFTDTLIIDFEKTCNDYMALVKKSAILWSFEEVGIEIDESIIDELDNELDCVYENFVKLPNSQKIDDLVIYGYGDSTSEAYANEHSFKFVDLNHVHAYTEKITKEVTCTENGEKTYTCECGDSYAEVIPATGHIDEDDNGYCDICGSGEYVDTRYTVAEGQCGDNAYWLFRSDSVLIIRGEGEMWDFKTPNNGHHFPWYEYLFDIEKIIIEDGITNISCDAFSPCINVTDVILPNSLVSIGEYAFAYCLGLKEIKLPDNIETIGANAFHYCSNLESVILPANLKRIEECAFIFCGLKNIKIPDSVTDIGEGAFAACFMLETAELPSNIKTIGDEAFYSCFCLKEITIPESIENIGSYAFGECLSLKKATVLSETIDLKESGLGFSTLKISGSIEEFAKDYLKLNEIYYKYDLGYKDYEFEYIEDLSNDLESRMTEFDEPQKIDDLVIYGYGDSTSEAYANEHGFKFVDLNHVHAYTEKITKEVTCTENGEKTYTCSCGDSYKEIIYSEGHSFGEWITTKEPTAFENGEKTRTCSTCGITESDIIPIMESTDNNTGVVVIYPDHSFDSEIHVVANHLNEGETNDKLTEIGYDRFVVYDISVYIDNEEVQPNGKIWVKIPVPDSFDKKNCSAFYIPDSGKPERVQSYYQDGYVYIETSHFSHYAIVDESSLSTPDDPEINCDCICHKTGFMGFIYKILRILWKMFGINKTCDCGNPHW